MNIETKDYAPLLLVPFFLVILLSVILTPWQTSEVERITTNTGIYDVSQIRGWMTPNEVSDATGISVEKIYEISNITIEINPNTPLKEIKNYIEGFETDSVKVAIDNYQNNN
jgi:hypothetical protein